MRHFILCCLFLILLGNSTLAQYTIQATAFPVINDLRTFRNFTGNPPPIIPATITCSRDTVYYPYFKTTSFQAISMAATGTSSAYGQWYPTPQPITVSGFDFFAWQSAGTNVVVQVTCAIYAAGADSLPIGAPLRSTIIAIDSSFHGGTLSGLRKTVTFSSPFIATAPYVVVLSSSSNTNVSIVTNNWAATNPDGRTEWLSCAKFTNWVRSYTVNVNSIPFNADIILMPHVSYAVTANFTPSITCINNNTNVTFTNTSSPVIQSKFYSYYAFYNSVLFCFRWNYGDNTGTYYNIQGNHTYSTANNYSVTLTDSMYGWTRNCGESKTIDLFGVPSKPWAYSNSTVCNKDTATVFTDSVANISYQWQGPGSFISLNRVVNFANATEALNGYYHVWKINQGCYSESDSVELRVMAPVPDVNGRSNGPLCFGQTLSLEADSIFGMDYSWSGPSQFSNAARKAEKSNVNFADAGTYFLDLIYKGCPAKDSIEVIISATPSAPVVSNSGPICKGDSLYLMASTIVGANYSWFGPNSFSSTLQNPFIANMDTSKAGLYQVIATVPGCGPSPVASTNAIVPLFPAKFNAVNIMKVCSGDTITLSADTVQYGIYKWSGPGNYNTNTQVSELRITDDSKEGIYNVKLSLPGCKTSMKDSVEIKISKPSTSEITGPDFIIKRDQPATYMVSNVQGSKFNWSVTGGQQIGNGTQNEIEVTWDTVTLGSVSVVQTDFFGCVASQKSMNVTLAELVGLKEFTGSENFMVYPNPASVKVFVPLEFTNSGYSIETVLGSTVTKGTIQSNGSIDLNNLKSGVYLLRIQNGNEWKTSRLIIQSK